MSLVGVVQVLVAASSALNPSLSRRSVLTAPLVAIPSVAVADETVPVVLTDEEMAARVARKQELLRRQASGMSSSSRGGLDGYIASDINPEAGANLRSRSVLENAKASLAKQEELKSRSKAQKRDHAEQEEAHLLCYI